MNCGYDCHRVLKPVSKSYDTFSCCVQLSWRCCTFDLCGRRDVSKSHNTVVRGKIVPSKLALRSIIRHNNKCFSLPLGIQSTSVIYRKRHCQARLVTMGNWSTVKNHFGSNQVLCIQETILSFYKTFNTLLFVQSWVFRREIEADVQFS